MLILPETNARGRFSKAQLAEIGQGAKVRLRVKPDPIIAMVQRADAILNLYYETNLAVWEAEQKLPEADRSAPAVYIVDELLNVEWSNGEPFTSLQQIDAKFKAARGRAEFRIKNYRKEMAALRPGHGSANLRVQYQQQISQDRRAIRLFGKCRAPMKAAWRRESARLLKVQSRVGLPAAYKKHLANYQALQRVTKEISESKPKTLDGALAVAAYVERRLWCDKPQLFADGDDLPGHFGELLRDALRIIKAEAS